MTRLSVPSINMISGWLHLLQSSDILLTQISTLGTYGIIILIFCKFSNLKCWAIYKGFFFSQAFHVERTFLRLMGWLCPNSGPKPLHSKSDTSSKPVLRLGSDLALLKIPSFATHTCHITKHSTRILQDKSVVVLQTLWLQSSRIFNLTIEQQDRSIANHSS